MISRTSYYDRECSLEVDFYEGIYVKVKELLKPIIGNSGVYFSAIDATQFNLKKRLSQEGLKLNKNQMSVNGMMFSVYNVTTGLPTYSKLHITKTKERHFYII